MRGHPSLRSLAPPLPNRPTALGSVGGPKSWAVKKRGRCHWQRPLAVPSVVTPHALRHGALCACSRAFSASPYLMRLKKASIPRYCATSPSSSQSPLPSGRPCLGIPTSAPLLLLSPTDPLRWARLGTPGAGRLKKRGRCHWQRPLAVPSVVTPHALRHGALCACSRAFSASPYLMRLKKASIPRYCATSPSSSQSPLPSGRPCLGIPTSAPLLLLSPTDPLRWARLGTPGAGRLKKRGRCHWQRPLAVPSVVTPHALRHGALLTAPQKTPLACGQTAFLSARLTVRLLPGVQRFALLEVEESVHTQVLRHVALVVAKSAPVGTPLPGHPSLRSLAPPLPNRPTTLGSVGDPRSWATQKAGPLPMAAAPCGSFVYLRLKKASIPRYCATSPSSSSMRSS